MGGFPIGVRCRRCKHACFLLRRWRQDLDTSLKEIKRDIKETMDSTLAEAIDSCAIHLTVANSETSPGEICYVVGSCPGPWDGDGVGWGGGLCGMLGVGCRGDACGHPE